MAHLLKCMLRGLLQAGAIIAFLIGPAAAQPTVNWLDDAAKRPLTAEEAQKQMAAEKAYKSATEKVPEQKAAADPWGNVRPPASSKTKQKQQ